MSYQIYPQWMAPPRAAGEVTAEPAARLRLVAGRGNAARLWRAVFRSGTRSSRVPSSASPIEPARLHTPCTPAATQSKSKAELKQ